MLIYFRFLDSRTFATCSDDTTVALWDVRNLKQKMRTLRGHSNWVKNIEYAREEGLLVTSGFDGCIFTWDINSYTEQGNSKCVSLSRVTVSHFYSLFRFNEPKNIPHKWLNENAIDTR